MIDVSHLFFSYDPDCPVLKDISFSIAKGEFVAIIGHNGSGKSTLAKLIAGLMEVKQGTITIDGVPLTPKTIQALRPHLGIVFQNPDNQFIGATVADDLAFGLENRRVPHEAMDGLIHQYAKYVEVEAFLHHEPTSLSGGQKQRVAIAGILAMQPRIMIFDEATAMLDPTGKEEIRRLLSKLRKEQPELTIILITHDLDEASLADRILVFHEGTLALQGTPEAVFHHQEKLLAMSLDVPFLEKLKAQLPREQRQHIHSIDDWIKVVRS